MRVAPDPHRVSLDPARGTTRPQTLGLGTLADDGDVRPQSGAFDRILASHFSQGQGADYATGGCGSSAACSGEMRGQLQPYAIYVPTGTPPPGSWGLTLLLHSLSANYNQFAGSHNQSQFANRGSGSIVITPSGRGPDGWYYDHAGADTFETWADVAAHYQLNPAFTDITGYSMGGIGAASGSGDTNLVAPCGKSGVPWRGVAALDQRPMPGRGDGGANDAPPSPWT